MKTFTGTLFFLAKHKTDCSKCLEYHKVLAIDYVNRTITVLVNDHSCSQEIWNMCDVVMTTVDVNLDPLRVVYV